MQFTTTSRAGTVCFFVYLFLSLSPLSLQAQEFESTHFYDPINLGTSARVFEAGEREYSIEEIRENLSTLNFVPLKSFGENFGFSDSNYWIHFKIENTTAESKQYYLETARPITDVVDLFIVNELGRLEKQVSGDKIPYNEKSVFHRKSIFKIGLRANETIDAFVNLGSDGEVVMAPLKLYQKEAFLVLTYKEQLFFGFFYGILLLAFIIYSFFFFALKDKSFVYYGLYVFFIGMLQFALDGFFHQYITPQGGWLSDRSVLLAALLSLIFFNKYGKTFLGIGNLGTILEMSSKFLDLLLIMTLAALVCLPSALKFCYPIANILGMAVLGQMILSIVYLRTKKVAIDNWFIGGISFLILGFVVFILNNFNLIENSFLTDNGSKIGIGLEIIFLSMSMSNRIRNLRMENEKNQALALQRSEDMNEIKSSLLSNISHELRTPLNLIMGMTTSIQYESRDREIDDKCKLIMNSSENLLAYIDDILDFTVIEKGSQNLREDSFELKPLISRVLAMNEKKAKQKGLGFNYTISRELPDTIFGDKIKIAQIMNNLLDNAVKFTTSGHVDFVVNSIEEKGRDVVLEFYIKDTGVGIPKEKMNTIFESFTKKSFKDKREYSGLGLGLYVVKNYVKLHNGTISITNNKADKGGGVTCKVTLKLKPGGEMMKDKKILHQAERNAVNIDILMVEDNKMNQTVMKLILKKRKNFALTIANNGQEALDVMVNKSFDLILMDLQMPVMDGFETTQAIRTGNAPCPKNIPIVVVTADCTSESKERAKLLGVNDFMTKPIKPNVVYQKILDNLDISVDYGSTGDVWLSA